MNNNKTIHPKTSWKFFYSLSEFIFKVACFMTGRMYGFLKNCSYKSRKRTMVYFAGMLIVGIIWFFVAYQFSRMYIKLDVFWALIVGAVAMFVVWQIERIIINSDKNWKNLLFRSLLALCMSMIGAVIIDQFIFKDDIEKQRKEHNKELVNKMYKEKKDNIDNEIENLNKQIEKLSDEKNRILNKIKANTTTKSIERKKDSTSKTTFYTEDNSHFQRMFNEYSERIDYLIKERQKLNMSKDSLRNGIEKEVNSYHGLLDELDILISVVTKKWYSKLLYVIILSFFLILELLVVVSKTFQKEDDYDFAIQHQSDVFHQHFQKLFEALPQDQEHIFQKTL